MLSTETAQLGLCNIQLELEDTKKFENMLYDKIQELEIELEDSNTDREREIVINGIDTLKCVLDHLFNLKYGEKERAMEIAEANDNFQQANRLRKTANQDPRWESEISAQIQN